MLLEILLEFKVYKVLGVQLLHSQIRNQVGSSLDVNSILQVGFFDYNDGVSETKVRVNCKVRGLHALHGGILEAHGFIKIEVVDAIEQDKKTIELLPREKRVYKKLQNIFMQGHFQVILIEEGLLVHQVSEV